MSKFTAADTNKTVLTKKKRRGGDSYQLYVSKVLRQVHPDMGISKKTVQILDSFVHDAFEKIVVEASRLVKLTGKETLSSREIQTAVKLVLPGELAKHAVSEGVRAIKKYESV